MPKLTKTYDVSIHLKLERKLLEQVREAAGDRNVNEWTRQAMREKLKRRTRHAPQPQIQPTDSNTG